MRGGIGKRASAIFYDRSLASAITPPPALEPALAVPIITGLPTATLKRNEQLSFAGSTPMDGKAMSTALTGAPPTNLQAPVLR